MLILLPVELVEGINCAVISDKIFGLLSSLKFKSPTIVILSS